MSKEINPYASPLSDTVEGVIDQRDLGTRVDGKVLFAPLGCQFPDRCVRCNASADGYRLKRKLSWHPRWIYIFVVVAILIYVIAALVTRKEARFDIGLCKTHRRKRRRFMATWYSLAVAGLGCVLFGGVGFESPILAVIGFIGGFLSLLIGLVGSQVITANRITEDHAEIKGCGPDFLLSVA